MRPFTSRMLAFNQVLSASLASAMLLGSAGPAAGLTTLDDGNRIDMDPFHLKMGREQKAVGAIQTFDENGAPIALGSGNAIRGNWALTAAHVVVNANLMQLDMGNSISAGDPSHTSFGISDWYVPSSYDGDVISGSDIALVKLSSPNAIDPEDQTRINRDPNRKLVGKEYTMAGFGTTGTGNTGAIALDGQKRAGKNIFDTHIGLFGDVLLSDFDVDPKPRDFYGTPETRELIYGPGVTDEPNDLESPEDFRIAYETSHAAGDSGGGKFRDGKIQAVTSFGTGGAPFGGIMGDVEVEPWKEWIDAVIENGASAPGTLAGSPLNPIEIELEGESGGGDDDGSGADNRSNLHAQQQYYAGLYLDYFDDQRPDPDIEESLDMLGYTKRNQALPSKSELTEMLDLAVDPGTSDADFEIAARQKLDELLDKAYGYEQLKDMILKGFGNSDSAFATGMADAALLEAKFDELDFTLGDADEDGDVDLADLQRLADHWQESDREWRDGDFSFDLTVDEEDLGILEDAWLASENDGQTFEEALAKVNLPEPSSIALLSLSAAALLIRRRRAGRV